MTTAPQVAAYQTKGYIVVEDIYSPADVQEMRDALDGLIASARGLTDHTDVIDLEVADAQHLMRILSALRAIDVVVQADRV